MAKMTNRERIINIITEEENLVNIIKRFDCWECEKLYDIKNGIECSDGCPFITESSIKEYLESEVAE